ncbi:hypothetical protein [Aeromonas hydrophila]|uniref:hypothetical protein n=1 Tax=Aeromonas hydrophila TaxID=644 RepID=UPI00235FA167|nr:hypothetical protein [Aeromonas hydrophila]
MSKFFNFGFIAIIISAITRYYFSTTTGFNFLQIKTFQNWEMWMYAISIAWFILALWNVFVRRRCPRCQDYAYSYEGSEEIDRWVGSKKVRERVGKDTYADRHVTTTFAKVRHEYRCSNCGHQWAELVKEELS